MLIEKTLKDLLSLLGLWPKKNKRGLIIYFETSANYSATSVNDERHLTHPRISRECLDFGSSKFFPDDRFGLCTLTGAPEKKDRKNTGFARKLVLFQWEWMPLELCDATMTFHWLVTQALNKKY